MEWWSQLWLNEGLATWVGVAEYSLILLRMFPEYALILPRMFP
jgi:aminopeptidase N